MEQIVQKPPLPTKTKIAAWWMIITGVIFGLLYGGLVLIVPSIFLFLRKRVGFWLAMIVLLLLICIGFLAYFFVPLVFLFIIIFPLPYQFHLPRVWYSALLVFLIFQFILLLLDRKNFWKVAK
jgi:hypothetical protein